MKWQNFWSYTQGLCANSFQTHICLYVFSNPFTAYNYAWPNFDNTFPHAMLICIKF